MLITAPIGWLVFYLITKQVNPFSKPDDLSKRPRWFLGIALGLDITFTYSMSLVGDANSDAVSRFVVRTAFFIFYLIPILIFYLFYRHKSKKAVNSVEVRSIHSNKKPKQVINKDAIHTKIKESPSIEQFMMLVPKKVYHAFDGKVKLFDEKGLSFNCGCGQSHLTTESFAIIDSGISNHVVYICPRYNGIFNLVVAGGTFSIKKLNTLTVFYARNEEQLQDIMVALELRKKTE